MSLNSVCMEANKNWKSEIVQFGVKTYDVDVIPLSSPRANYCLYGGIPIGRLIEFFGAEGSGKTATALDVCANAQNIFTDKKIIFVDAENTYDPKWAAKLGVNSDELLIMKPETQTAEEIFQFILDAIDTGEVGLVVIDSLGVMLSEQAYDKDIGERTYGGISMPLTTFSKKAELLCHKYGCTIIGINQMRDNLSSAFGGTITTGGKAWKHNCFGANTQFVTDKGLCRFRDCKDGEQVTVVDKNGVLREATVHYYGFGELQTVTLHTPNMKHSVVCTPDHRWVLMDGTVTQNLKVGDSLYIRPDTTEFNVKTQRQAEMFCMGMVIADGCDHKIKDVNRVEIVLCGKKEQYSNIFEKANYRSMKFGNRNGYQKIRISKQAFLDGECWKYLSAEDKKYLFHGYYAGDGHVGYNACSTVDNRVLSFIQDTCGMAGYFLTSIKECVSNECSYKPGAHYFKVQFTTHQTTTNHWVVESIRKTDSNGLYCVEEPITHTFTLEKGIVTGNCSLRVEFKRGDFFDTNYTKVNQTYENPFGNYVQMSVIKSKCFPNDRKTGQYTLCYYNGIDYLTDTVDLAIKIGIIIQSGAWFNIVNPITKELITKCQGRPNVIKYLNENEDIYNLIKTEMDAYITGGK